MFVRAPKPAASWLITKSLCGLVFMAGLAACTLPASAADHSAKKGSGWSFAVGAGAVYMPDFEGSKRYKFQPVPYLNVSYKGGLIEFSGSQLTMPVIRLGKGMFKAGPLIKVGMGRDEKDNRIALKGLGDIGVAVEAGGFASMDFRYFTVGVNAAQDVAGGHKGYSVEGSIGTSVPLSQSLAMDLGINTAWTSRKYMNRFFGISAKQSVASGLPVYSPSAGFKNVGANLGLNYALSKRWMMTGGMRYERLLEEAANSPLVRDRGSKDQMISYLFLVYGF